MKNSTYHNIFDTTIYVFGKLIFFAIIFSIVSLAYYGFSEFFLWQWDIIFPFFWWSWILLTIPTLIICFIIVALEAANRLYNRQGIRYIWLIFGTNLILKRQDTSDNNYSDCKEIDAWLDENANSLFERYSANKDHIYYVFLKESDAMACKLRWDAEQ